MDSLGRLLISSGVFLGLMLVFRQKLPFIGKLPGDIYVQNERVRFFFPLGTSLLLSVVLTILLNLIFRLFGR